MIVIANKELSRGARIHMLEAAIKDAEWRIGSHIAITWELDEYVKNQKRLIVIWTEQLEELMKEGDDNETE